MINVSFCQFRQLSYFFRVLLYAASWLIAIWTIVLAKLISRMFFYENVSIAMSFHSMCLLEKSGWYDPTYDIYKKNDCETMFWRGIRDIEGLSMCAPKGTSNWRSTKHSQGAFRPRQQPSKKAYWNSHLRSHKRYAIS